MKSSVIDSPTDMCSDSQHTPAGMPLAEMRFATEPMHAVRPAYTRQREQEERRFATVPALAFRPASTCQRELRENQFATEPMFALPSVRTLQLAQEEEWHTSFEQAISERAARVSLQLCRLSTTGLERAVPETDPLPAATSSVLARVGCFWCAHKRTIVLFCLGFGLFLVGFDLMGLLVVLR